MPDDLEHLRKIHAEFMAELEKEQLTAAKRRRREEKQLEEALERLKRSCVSDSLDEVRPVSVDEGLLAGEGSGRPGRPFLPNLLRQLLCLLP